MKAIDLINKRIEKLKAKIKPELSAEEMQAITDETKELEEARAEIEKQVEDISKYKDKLIDMVMTSGSPKTPDEDKKNIEDPGTGEPKSLEEVIQEACDAKDNGGK